MRAPAQVLLLAIALGAPNLRPVPALAQVHAAFAPRSILSNDLRLYPVPVQLATTVFVLPSDSATDRPARTRHAILGGVLGAAAGVAVCTLMSNALFNEGTGTSTCTTKGNLLFGAGGLVLGAYIGWVI